MASNEKVHEVPGYEALAKLASAEMDKSPSLKQWLAERDWPADHPWVQFLDHPSVKRAAVIDTFNRGHQPVVMYELEVPNSRPVFVVGRINRYDAIVSVIATRPTNIGWLNHSTSPDPIWNPEMPPRYVLHPWVYNQDLALIPRCFTINMTTNPAVILAVLHTAGSILGS